MRPHRRPPRRWPPAPSTATASSLATPDQTSRSSTSPPRPSPHPPTKAAPGPRPDLRPLLRAALFGPDTHDRVASSATACSSSSSPGPSPVGTPATGNIFRFKTEVRRSAKRALFSGEEEEDALFPGIFTTRGAGPRKVPRSPYKVRRGIGFGAFLIGPSLFLDLGFLGSVS